MDSTGAKLLSLFLLLGLSLVIGCIPLFFRQLLLKKKIRTILDYSSCLAGGIFVGTGLLHLLPEIAEKFNEYYEAKGITIDYPLMQLCIGLGFFAVFLLEHGVMGCRSKSGGWNPTAHLHSHGSSAKTSSPKEYHTGACEAANAKGKSPSPPVLTEEEEDHGLTPIDPTFKDFLLFIVMYLHAIFEGLALGLLDSVSDVLSLLLAVTIHKSVILASLVVQLVVKNVKRAKSLLLVLIFTVMAPIGIAIGIIMDKVGSQETPSGVLATGIMNAFATGTLFFVVFMEILPEGFRSGKSPFSRAMVVFFGFCIIALLSLIPEHHNHLHHSCEEMHNATNATNGTDHDHI
eukprot:m.238401 g.238401  ORF g.238401 m.238401 type:complete len:346 (+) comp40163_c0_seq24:377-1414(+)